MADKQISALPEASEVQEGDLFVLQQSNQAKKITGQTLITELAEALDGHGGIADISQTGQSGIVKTYTITYTDGTETTFDVSNGEQGMQGLQTYVHIRYSSAYPPTAIGTTPDNYIGIATTTSSAAPSSPASYTWYKWKGEQGDTGAGITGISKTGTSGAVDTYTIAFSNGLSTTFNVTNGSSIQSISLTGTSGRVDTYTVTLTDGSTSTFNVTNAKSISSVELINGNHAAGTTDTYRITYNDGDAFDFPVYNGANGSGAVSTVSGIPVVGQAGDVPAVIIGSTTPTSDTVGYINQLYYNTSNSVLYICISTSGGTFDWRGAGVTVDSALSSTSTNPVQNKVIYQALSGKVATTTTVNNKALSSNVTLSASDVGAVPTSRTINGTALSQNVVTRLMFTNVQVSVSAWASDGTYTDYPYKASVALNDVTASMFPDVVLDIEELSSGNFAPVCETYLGGIYVFAKEIPSDAITIPSIVCLT